MLLLQTQRRRRHGLACPPCAPDNGRALAEATHGRIDFRIGRIYVPEDYSFWYRVNAIARAALWLDTRVVRIPEALERGFRSDLNADSDCT